MTMNIVDPSLAQGAMEAADTHERQRQIDAMRRNLNSGSRDKKARLREACEGFEAVFIQKMWEQMRATVPQDGMMHSKDEKIWQGMYDQELAKKMAGAGGIGLADMMMEQLGRNLEEAAPKTLNTSLVHRQGFMPVEPAPLVIEPLNPLAEADGDVKADDIYNGLTPAVAEAPSEADQPVDPEFEALVGRLQVEMQEPVITRTRVTTNATTLNTYGRGGRRKNVPRVSGPQATPQPAAEPGPSTSPTSVSQARTEAVAAAPTPRR